MGKPFKSQLPHSLNGKIDKPLYLVVNSKDNGAKPPCSKPTLILYEFYLGQLISPFCALVSLSIKENL